MQPSLIRRSLVAATSALALAGALVRAVEIKKEGTAR